MCRRGGANRGRTIPPERFAGVLFPTRRASRAAARGRADARRATFRRSRHGGPPGFSFHRETSPARGFSPMAAVGFPASDGAARRRAEGRPAHALGQRRNGGMNSPAGRAGYSGHKLRRNQKRCGGFSSGHAKGQRLVPLPWALPSPRPCPTWPKCPRCLPWHLALGRAPHRLNGHGPFF